MFGCLLAHARQTATLLGIGAPTRTKANKAMHSSWDGFECHLSHASQHTVMEKVSHHCGRLFGTVKNLHEAGLEGGVLLSED